VYVPILRGGEVLTPPAYSTTAVAAGDLSKKINVEAFGEILQLKARLASDRMAKLTGTEYCEQHGGKFAELLV